MFATNTQIIYENVTAGQTYSLPFDWLDNSQILVFGDSEKLTETSQYTLDKTARTIVPLSNYGKLIITRYTLGSNLAYDFKNTKSLRADELQRALDIIRYLGEERATQSLQLGSEGTYDALGKRIGNLGAPLEDSDAATKGSSEAYVQSEAMTLQDGNYNARGKRITNLSLPQDLYDAATKSNVDAVKDLADFYYNLLKKYTTLEQPYVDAGILDDIFIDNVYDCFTAFTTTYERVFDGGTAYTTSFVSELNGGVAYNG